MGRWIFREPLRPARQEKRNFRSGWWCLAAGCLLSVSELGVRIVNNTIANITDTQTQVNVVEFEAKTFVETANSV